MTTDAAHATREPRRKRHPKSLPQIVEATDPTPATDAREPETVQRVLFRFRDMWQAGNQGAPAGAPADKWLVMLSVGVLLFSLGAYLGLI